MTTEGKWILVDSQRFYYTEVNLFHGRKQIDRAISKENLEIFKSIVEESQIIYGLFFGTLLGAIREKNFIEHDEDTDIYILEEDRVRFFKLLYLFKEQKLEVVRYENDMLTLMRNNEYIDVYFFKLKYKLGFKKLRVYLNEYEYAAKNLENPIKLPFLGMSISVPDNPELIVRKIFGKDWRIPMKNKPSEPNTVYKKISNMAFIARKFPFANIAESGMKKLLKVLGY